MSRGGIGGMPELQQVPIGSGLLAGGVATWAPAGTNNGTEPIIGMFGLVFFAPVEEVVVSRFSLSLSPLSLGCSWGTLFQFPAGNENLRGS